MALTLSQMERRCSSLLVKLQERGGDYGLSIFKLGCGALVIDAGVEAQGSLEAGRLITELCHGGFCTTSLSLVDIGGVMLPQITVQSFYPTFSAYGLQTACEINGEIVSGPIRLRLEHNPLIKQDITYEQASSCGITIIQSDDFPTEAWVRSLADQSGCEPGALTLIVAPTQSAAGTTQIAGRINEDIIFSLEKSIGYDSTKVKQLLGSSPIAPLSKDQQEFCRAFPDDFLHYAGQAFLVLDAEPGEDVQGLAQALCFSSTSIYGRFFGDILEEVKGVFMDIPGLIDINKVAQVTINDLNTGRIYSAGKRDVVLLKELLALKSKKL